MSIYVVKWAVRSGQGWFAGYDAAGEPRLTPCIDEAATLVKREHAEEAVSLLVQEGLPGEVLTAHTKLTDPFS